MSTWTHVAGTIRVDAFRGIMPTPAFDKIFVKALFDDDDEAWDKCNMPMGSEGSLDYQIIENPSESAAAAYTVAIFGDLRDYGKDKLEEIKTWWNRVLKECGLIRQAVLQIEFEDSEESVVLEYSVTR